MVERRGKIVIKTFSFVCLCPPNVNPLVRMETIITMNPTPRPTLLRKWLNDLGSVDDPTSVVLNRDRVSSNCL